MHIIQRAMIGKSNYCVLLMG